MLVEDANVIAVNWEYVAKGPLYNYLSVVDKVGKFGSAIGNFIKSVNMNYMNVHCIGHSLGAHVCGFAGKTVKLGRISGKIILLASLKLLI